MSKKFVDNMNDSIVINFDIEEFYKLYNYLLKNNFLISNGTDFCYDYNYMVKTDIKSIRINIKHKIICGFSKEQDYNGYMLEKNIYSYRDFIVTLRKDKLKSISL